MNPSRWLLCQNGFSTYVFTILSELANMKEEEQYKNFEEHIFARVFKIN